MSSTLKSLIFVTIVNTMMVINVHAGLFSGNFPLLDLSLFGTEKSNARSYVALAQKLASESDVILMDINRYCVGECQFGAELSFKVSNVKIQINKMSSMLASCEKNRNAKETLRFELNNLAKYIRDLKVEISRLRSIHSGECLVVLSNISNSVDRLEGCVGSTCFCSPKPFECSAVISVLELNDTFCGHKKQPHHVFTE